MEVKYDISKYITSVKMSSKKRILVEGKEDKSHIKNLLDALLGKTKITIDTAQNIKGECGITAKNNRAKIEKIHRICKESGQHENLFFLCDREYFKFNIGKEIEDLMSEHENDGNLSWTIGHSLENYFVDSELIIGAFRYLSGSEFKTEAAETFRKILPSALKLVAAIALSAKDIDKCTYPGGTVQWHNFMINDGVVSLDIESWRKSNTTQIAKSFCNKLSEYIPIVENTDQLICSRVCRGHTAILMLQRIFSACIYCAGRDVDEASARRDASDFGKVRESSVSVALCEAWIGSIKGGSDNYPVNLIGSVAQSS